MIIPEELRKLNNWVCWRYENGKKPPVNPKTGKAASSTDPATWSDVDTAIAAKEQYGCDGIGVFTTESDFLVFTDIDHCVDPKTGEFNDVAKDALSRCDTYAEYSPSSEGVHLIAHGTKPKGACKNSQTGVEMYDHARYLTFTGRVVPGHPTEIKECTAALGEIHRLYVAKDAKTAMRAEIKTDSKKNSKDKGGKKNMLEDHEVIEKAQSAGNGDRFQQLFAGDWRVEYRSQSEADLALCKNLAFWTQKDAAQMDRIFRQSVLYRPKWDEPHGNGKTYGEMTIARAIESTADVYTPPSRNKKDKGPKVLTEQDGHYVFQSGESVKQITNFIIVPEQRIVSEEATQMDATLISDTGAQLKVTFTTSDFSSSRAFKAVLNKKTIAFSFLGSDNDLEHLKIYLAGLPWPEKKGVAVVGTHPYKDSFAFVCGEGAIGADGNPTEALAMLDVPNIPQTGILAKRQLTPDELYDIGFLLTHYNDPMKTLPVLAWVSGCFIKPHLNSVGIKFPHLALIGEAGSGKSTTLSKVVLPFFSVEQVTAAPEVTTFSLLQNTSVTNTIPFGLDEFKPSKIEAQRLHALLNLLRDAYDGYTAQRGRTDRKLDTYKHVAPIVIAGEESPAEAAIRERLIEILFMRCDLKKSSYKLHFQNLERKAGMIGNMGYSLLLAALNTTVDECVVWYQEGKNMVATEFPSRIVNNLGCCYAGLRLLGRMCSACGKNFEDTFDFTLSDCMEHMQHAVQEYMLGGSTHNKNILDETFEIMARMHLDSSYWRLVPNKAAGYDELWMRIGEFYDAYTKYRRDRNISGEMLSINEFKKQLKRSEVFIRADGQMKVEGQNCKFWVLNLTELGKRCDISGFYEPPAVEKKYYKEEKNERYCGD